MIAEFTPTANVTDIPDLAKTDPVNFTLTEVQKQGTTFHLDGDNQPTMEIKDDPTQTLHRLLDANGKPSLRARAYFRGVYRYATQEKLHLGLPELNLLVDYAVEGAYKGGRKAARLTLEKQGDYNFEAVVAFANFLTDPARKDEKGVGNQLLDGLTAGVPAPLKPVLAVDKKADTLTATLRTADLWKAVESKPIADVVHASKATLYTAINFFSRRLAELEVQFQSVGLSLTFSHRESGSWVTLVRKNALFHPDATVLKRTDDRSSSASEASSALKSQETKAIEPTDDNAISRDPAPASVA